MRLGTNNSKQWKSEKIQRQEALEIALFGSIIKSFILAKPEFLSNAGYAMAIISDAQEVMFSDREVARQMMNKAKYFLSEITKEERAA